MLLGLASLPLDLVCPPERSVSDLLLQLGQSFQISYEVSQLHHKEMMVFTFRVGCH